MYFRCFPLSLTSYVTKERGPLIVAYLYFILCFKFCVLCDSFVIYTIIYQV